MKRLILICCLLFSAHAQASLWDDLMSLLSGGEGEDAAMEEAPATPEAGQPGDGSSGESPSASMGASAMALGGSAAMGLLPVLSESLGVTDAQARGGLGALFVAARTVLAEEDFATLAGAVPDIDGMMAAAPKTNDLLGSALKFGGVSSEVSAGANLLAQFNSLGLDPAMIAKYGNVAKDYLKETAPEASKQLASAMEGMQ